MSLSLSTAVIGDGSSSPMRLTSQTSDSTQTTLIQEHLARELISTEWTDEKHSLYIKSMEASFVNDMYNSFDFLGYQIEHPKFSKQKQAASCNSSGQFKVLRSGCWEKINFERNRSQRDKVDDPAVLLANPWIRHFRSSCGRQTPSTPHEKVELVADVSSYDSVEVTDQNFVDDEEDAGETSSHMCNAKRIKTSIAQTPK